MTECQASQSKPNADIMPAVHISNTIIKHKSTLKVSSVRFSGCINGDGVRCILGAAKIVYCFGQVTSVTDDLSMGLTSVPT